MLSAGSPLQVAPEESQQTLRSAQSTQHLQGTIV